MEVVEQPLGGRRDRTLLVDCLAYGLVGVGQDPRIVGAAPGEPEPGKAQIPSGLCFCKTLGVLFQPLRAEYFGP